MRFYFPLSALHSLRFYFPLPALHSLCFYFPLSALHSLRFCFPLSATALRFFPQGLVLGQACDDLVKGLLQRCQR